MRRPTIAILINGAQGSAMDIRARAFAERLRNDFHFHIVYRAERKVYATFRFLWELLHLRPELCYVLDMGFSGVLAAGCYRGLFRRPIVTDTGDAIYDLSRNSGRGPIALGLTKLLENFALAVSDRIVVRSHPHQELLRSRGVTADVIPDGVDVRRFAVSPQDELRCRLQLDGYTVIGLLGSLIWNPRFRTCYGWELIELVDSLRGRAVKGIIIGDGSGLPILKAECATRGLMGRIVFLGRLPYDQLPQYLNLMHICLSTQTNDVPGQVRTTGKLPLYLGCGRFVLASSVGEAARVLPPAMLVPYQGSNDTDYPKRLAERVEWLIGHPEVLQQAEVSTGVAKSHFDYDLLAARLRQTFRELLCTTVTARNSEYVKD